MNGINIPVLISCGIYTVFVIGVGLYKSRQRADDSVDYYLAGRSLRAWASAFSGAASAESGWVLLGLVGVAYSSGISAFWLLPGTITGYLFNWLVLAPRLRKASMDSRAITIPEVLSNRHNGSHRVRWVGCLIILFFMSAYVAAQFNAVGKSLLVIFGIPYLGGVAIALAIVLGYVVVGGFAASVWTDFVQALFIVLTLVVLPVLGIVRYDGNFLSDVSAQQASLLDISGGNSGMALLGFIIGWVGIGLGYPGQTHILVRFMATKDDAEIRRASIIATIWSTTVFSGAIVMGLVARVWVPGLEDPEQALPEFASLFLPGVVAGFVLAAILAAICSTADSQLLVASSAASHDILGLKGKGVRRKNQYVIASLGCFAGLMAAMESRVIFDFVLYAWAGLGAGLGPPLIGSLFWPRTSEKGILAGMIGGVATVVIWKNVPPLASTMYELVPAFIVSLLLVRFVAPQDTGARK